jgi:hypothetical protein
VFSFIKKSQPFALRCQACHLSTGAKNSRGVRENFEFELKFYTTIMLLPVTCFFFFFKRVKFQKNNRKLKLNYLKSMSFHFFVSCQCRRVHSPTHTPPCSFSIHSYLYLHAIRSCERRGKLERTAVKRGGLKCVRDFEFLRLVEKK